MTDAEPARTRDWRRAWRILRAALVAVLSLYAFYVVAINAFLSSSLFDRVINQDAEMLDVHYRRGWSFFPGRIHAKELSIRSSDSNVEWILKIDEIEFDVSFLGLVRQRFDVGRAHGRGISMRVRQKLERAPDSLEEVALLPPVPGFPAFSVRPSGPPSLEHWYDSEYHLWTVRLEDVIAEDVREVWVDSGRFEGNARITGRFYLKPIRAVEIGPARVHVREGRVTAGESVTVAKHLSGTVDVTFARFDPRAIEQANGVLRHATVRTDLNASFADPATFPFAMPGGVHLSTEVDAPRIALRLDEGVLSPGTRVDLRTPKVLVSKSNVIGHAALEVTAEVTGDDQTSELRANVELTNVAVARPDSVGVLRAPRIALAADARALDLAGDPLRDAHVVIDLPEVELPDATVLNGHFPEDIGIAAGSARGSAHAELFASERRASGNGVLHAEDLDARLAKMRTRGTFDVTASFGAFRWEQDLVEDAKLSVRVAHGKLSSERDPEKPKVEAKELTLQAHSMKVDLADPLRSLEASFEMPEASIVDLELLAHYLPKANMKVLRGRSTFGFDGHVTVDDHVAQGELHVRSKALGLELGDVQVQAAVAAHAKVHDWKWEHGDLAVDDASVDITGVTMSRKDERKILASIDRITVGVTSPAFAFSDPLARVDLRAQIAGGKVDDPAAIDAFLPDGAAYGLASRDGRFEAAARLSITKRIARGKATAKAKGMGVRTAPFTVHGDALVELDIDRWDLEKKIMSLGASRLAISGVRGRFGKDGGSDVTSDAIELTGKARDLDIAHPALRGVDARLVLGKTQLPDARALQVLLPAGKAVRIESGTATASGELEISSSARSGSGTIALEIARGGIAVSKTQVLGDFAVNATVKGFDPDSSTIDLSSSRLAMREVSVRQAAAETTHWKGDVLLQQATLRLRGPQDDRRDATTKSTEAPGKTAEPAKPATQPVLDAIARLDADDARPLLGVLLRDSVPKFLVGLADMPKLEAYARLHVAPEEVVVSDVSASGGDIALRGAFALYDEDRRGAFVVEKGPVSIGLRLDNNGAKPRFFDLDDWLRVQERNVKAKASGPSKLEDNSLDAGRRGKAEP